MYNSMSEYLRTPEAAEHIGFSTEYLEIARHRGEGPPYCKLGRAVRYRRSSLDEWMRAHESAKAVHPAAPDSQSGGGNAE